MFGPFVLWRLFGGNLIVQIGPTEVIEDFETLPQLVHIARLDGSFTAWAYCVGSSDPEGL